MGIRGLQSGEARKTLPFDQWPQEDRLRWQEAFHAGDLFDTGPGAHLAEATRAALQFACARRSTGGFKFILGWPIDGDCPRLALR